MLLRKLSLTLLVVGISAVARPTMAADIAFGEYLAGECVTCHRKDGQDKGIPSITGWPADQFIAVLQSYKLKDRDNQVMRLVTSNLSDAEMAALAAYFETLKKPD
jgi:cytochrome c